MKIFAAALMLICSLNAYCQEDYTLTINDSSFKVALDKNYAIVINGKKVNLQIKGNDTLVYSDNFIRFSYPKGYTISTTKVEEGIEQITIMSAEGTGLIVQKYSTFNPSKMNELMLDEVTKESINYGFKMKRADYKKTISGNEFEINKAVLVYKDETNIYEVMSFGRKDEGLLIMTIRMDDIQNSSGQKLINMMWNTLSIK